MAAMALFLGQATLTPLFILVALVVALTGTMSAIPVFWQLPNLYLAGGAAAIGVAFINSVANLAGFGAPYALGLIRDATGSLAPGLYLVALIELMAALLVVFGIARGSRGKED
ncbi:putative tartrate transporter [compost metagenome]